MSATSPPTNSPLPNRPGTPVHTLSTTTDRFYAIEHRSQTYSHLADEIEPFVVGPIPAEKFLALFLPPSFATPPFKNGMFDRLIQMHSQHETSWYNVFVS